MNIYVFVTGLLGFLLFVSCKTELPEGLMQRKIKIPFIKVAWFLMKKQGDLLKAEWLGEALFVFALGLLLSLFAQSAVKESKNLLNGYQLERPEYGMGERVQQLQLQVEEQEEHQQMQIVLKERKHTQKEKQELLKRALREVEQEVLGENTSPDEIREALCLPETAADGVVKIVWTQDPIGLLDENGGLTEEVSEEGSLLQLRAQLDCEGVVGSYECALQLFPPNYTKEEAWDRALQKSLKEADDGSAQKHILQLPERLEGKKLVWSEPDASVLEYGIVFAAVAALLVWFSKNRKQKEQEEQQHRQLLLDYPTLLFKLSMLLNAGLTMQKAFSKIALEYREHGTGKHMAYEEMLIAYYEMQSGVPEARAYENFGKRCKESVYIKLGTMLSGNLQKGSEGLAQRLQEEALYSMEERRQMAKKLGEEAGTKLLLPMMLMLVVVLIIMMVPAVMAF